MKAEWYGERHLFKFKFKNNNKYIKIINNNNNIKAKQWHKICIWMNHGATPIIQITTTIIIINNNNNNS